MALDSSVLLSAKVAFESPFKIWNATLQNFKGGAFSYPSPNCALHDVWIGAGVRIKTGVTIGNGAIIGP